MCIHYLWGSDYIQRLPGGLLRGPVRKRTMQVFALAHYHVYFETAVHSDGERVSQMPMGLTAHVQIVARTQP